MRSIFKKWGRGTVSPPSFAWAVAVLPCLQDNYGFVLSHSLRKEAVLVDPPCGAPLLDFVKEKALTVVKILVTHLHPDHIGGIEDILAHFPEATVYLPLREGEFIAGKIPMLKGRYIPVEEGMTISLSEEEPCEVWDIGGHTLGHVGYYMPRSHRFFCGDTLFSMGCGRLLGGDAPSMTASLARLQTLPPHTWMYGAHEYTHSNGEFARAVLPHSLEVEVACRLAYRLRSAHQPTIPFQIGRERAINPFLRLGDKAVRHFTQTTEETEDVDVFARLREAKNRF